MRKTLGILLLALLMSGCSSRPGIPVSDSQSLVMEGAVLAGGIRASNPSLSYQDGATVAYSSLFNEQSHPVTLYYRFYWYDEKGLEIHPTDNVRALTLEPQSGKRVQSTVFYPNASKVRLFLSLRSEF
ncbi:DUF1425 domain-containing protein [Citrobacter sp. JGM124]|uniref:YcfL family protein n=1 Tax=Citrobacter sp. JGM124 TaxID=2799789 RepID=UPI001BA8A331|nr:DUF1425 domain-containing protein [Citrobacter sp. JGM124]MBS0847617.1 DUF1425 domain-containing protein [Citrobacter sp. JGM124]